MDKGAQRKWIEAVCSRVYVEACDPKFSAGTSRGAGQCLPNLVQSGVRQIEAVDGIRQSVVGTIR